MKNLILFLFLLSSISCSKQIDSNHPVTAVDQSVQRVGPQPTTFTKYTIQQGAHYCDQNTVKKVSGSSMNFIAKFDNTAIYILSDPNEATDINKLYGFSEGFDNHYNSARIGWRYLNEQLELFAYVYVNGTLLRDPVTYDPPFIKTVDINQEINCSIAVSGNSYIFKVDGIEVKTQRGPSTMKFNGYQQYPYFGGTLPAPHLMNFYIK